MRTSPILVAKIWKAPNVAETNGDGDAGEEEVKLVRKRSPLGIVVLRYKISTGTTTTTAKTTTSS